MAPLMLHAEEQVHKAVQAGDLQITSCGEVWRVRKRGWDRWRRCVVHHPCKRVRAENDTGTYLMVHAMIDGKRHCAQASRLIWLHMHGPIPGTLTINHKNGDKKDNRPCNLELATYSQNILHAVHVLKVGRTAHQDGEANHLAKLTAAAVRSIRAERQAGTPLLILAKRYGVSFQTVSKAARGNTWQSVS